MGTKTLSIFLVTLITGLACAAAPVAERRAPDVERRASNDDAPAPAADQGGRVTQVIRSDEEPSNAYAIGIGDLLSISVWKSPELSVEVPVRPDGRISVPLLGDIQAAGLTPLVLRDVLTEGFREFVTAPGVSVVIKEIRSRKVFVTGEVANPGAYDLQPRAKLMQILAMAGGLTPYAKGRVIVLRDSRDGKGDRRYEISLDSIISGKRPSDNLILQPGDTLVVP